MVSALIAAGKEVWILLQVPELDFQPVECVGRPISFEQRPRFPCSVPMTGVAARQRVYRTIVTDLSRRFPSLHVYDPVPFMCDAGSCQASRGGLLWYADEHHLSETAALFFAGKFPF